MEKKKKKETKSTVVTLQRVYEDKKFEGKEKRWVLISEDNTFYSYFGEWGEKEPLKEGEKAKLYFTESKKGNKVFRNVKDWEILEKPSLERAPSEETSRLTDYQLSMQSLNKAIEIAKITGGKDVDVLLLARRIKAFIEGKKQKKEKQSQTKEHT